MKKFLSALLALIMSLTLFTACDNGSNNTGNGGNTGDVGGNTGDVGGDTGDGGTTATTKFDIEYLLNGDYLDGNSYTMYKGDKLNLFAVPEGKNGADEKYNPTKLTWSSSDSTVVKVTSQSNTKYKAEVRGVKTGTATITAKDDKGTTDTFTVNVKEVIVSTTITDDVVFYVDDGEVEYTLLDKFNVTDNLALEYSSSDVTVASIKDNNKLLVKAKGKSTITAKNKNTGAMASFDIIVYDEAISAPSTSYLLVYNETEKGEADLEINSKYDITKLKITSDTPSVAVYENGKIKAKGEGSAIITISGGEGANVDTVEVEVIVVPVMENTVAVNSLTNSKVNFFGRNAVVGDGVRFEYTVSGFEFKFYGTAAYAEMSAVIANGYHPRFQVLVDGEKVDQTEVDLLTKSGREQDDAELKVEKSSTPNGQNIVNINTSTKTKYTLVEGLANGWHTVKVLKRTPAKRGSTIMDKAMLYSLSTSEGGFIGSAPERSNLKIEVYGDSISCAFGNLCGGDVMEENYTNGLLAYHYLAAEELNAEINVQAHSGWGILYDTSAKKDFLWPSKYNKLADGTTSYGMGYDADVIVINLGTNDAGGLGNSNFAGNKETFVADFANAYKAWINNLLSRNPDAKIILSYGMMGVDSNVKAGIEKTVQDLNNPNVTYLQFTPKGSGGHPSKSHHINNANELYNKIVAVLGL